MDPIIVLSIAFLASPFLAYVVLASPVSTRTKLIIAGVGIVVMIVVPLLVFIFAGGSGGGAG